MSTTHPYAGYHLSPVLENKQLLVPPSDHQPNPSSPPSNAHSSTHSAQPQPQPQLQPPAPPLPPPRRGTPRHHYLIFALACCAFPPVLSLLGLAIGHSVLQYAPSILSSVRAGACGGAILSVPIMLLLYLLFEPNKQPRPSATSPENFFEDDNSSFFGQNKLGKYAPWLFLAILILLIGTIAGPLGVTVLASEDSRILTPAQAATAGIVGSVILLGGLLILAAAILTTRVGWIRYKSLDVGGT